MVDARKIPELLQRAEENRKKPVPHLSLKTWEHRGKRPEFDAAIRAIESGREQIGRRRRSAVAKIMKKLRGDNLRGSESRLHHFEVHTLGMPAVVYGDALCGLILKHLRKIPKALDAFAKGAPIGNLQQVSIGYLMKWASLEIGEREMYEASCRRLKAMGSRRAR